MRTSFFTVSFERPNARLRLVLERVIAKFRHGIHRSTHASSTGIEFRGFKPYEPSDPPGAIDYFASERFSDEPELMPVVRMFHPEREIGVVFLLDISETMRVPQKKFLCALEVLWLFALSAFKFHDRFRIVFFDETPRYDSGWLFTEDAVVEFFSSFSRGKIQKLKVSHNIFSYLAGLSLSDTMIPIVSDFAVWDKAGLGAVRRLNLFERNIKPVFVVLDEWEGFCTSGYTIKLRDPRTANIRNYSPGEVAELVRVARESLSDLRDKVRPLSVPFIEVPLIADAVSVVQNAFLRMGYQ